MPHPAKSARCLRGFTLVEILVAMGLLALLTPMVLGLTINLLKSEKNNGFKLSINRDVRSLTNDLTDNATFANYFVILPDYSTRTLGSGSELVLANVADGEAGDCVVFVFKDPEDEGKIQRLVGYYHDPDESRYGPLRKFVTNFSPSSADPLWDLLPPVEDLHTNPDLIQASMDGTAVGTTSSGRMFYNFFNRSVMVKGQINYMSRDGMTRRAVSTYNLTVSPRG